MVARDKMTGPSAALTAKSASSHSSEGTYAAKWSAPVSAGGKTDPCPHTHGRSITWDVWRTQRAFALQFGIGLRDIESWRGYLGARESCGARHIGGSAAHTMTEYSGIPAVGESHPAPPENTRQTGGCGRATGHALCPGTRRGEHRLPGQRRRVIGPSVHARARNLDRVQ